MNVQEIISEIIQHLRGMWRFRWPAIALSWAVALIGWYVVYSMPNIYEASARVSVDTNSLLPALTQGLTANENVMNKVVAVSKALLTRPNLERVARTTDLDLRVKGPGDMEALITGLQQRVRIVGGRDNVFNISYQDRNRDKARDVIAELLNSFVESSLGAQGDDADMTERALASEIKDHEDRLVKAEQDLADFKKMNIGYMPNEGSDYYSQLQAALASVTETEKQMRQLQQRREEVSRQLEGEEPVFGIMSSSPMQSAGGCSQAASISKLQSDLSALRVEFTDKHPRILTLQGTIEALEAECLQEQAEVGPSFASPMDSQPLEANPVYQNLRLQLSNADVELAALREEYSTRQREVSRLRADVDKIAEVETALKRLNRDYGVVSSRYQELLKRWESLQSKQRLDPVTDSVQFNILEPPFAAADPVSPDRPILLAAVLVLALGLGGAFTFGMNQLKPVFYTRRSITEVAGLPVLGTVSLIISPDDLSRKRRRTLSWIFANLGLVMVAVVVIVFEQPASTLLRGLGGGAGV